MPISKKQAKRTAGLKQGSYANRNFEAFTISWLPHDFSTNPNLCVFKGLGARLVPLLHYDGTPITARFIHAAIADKAPALNVVPNIVPMRKAAP